MSDAPEMNLLGELVRLARKYGPEVFESLAKLIRSPDATRRLAELLTVVSESAHESPAKRVKREPGKRPPTAQRLLDELEKSAPEKARILRPFHESLRERKHLPHPQDLIVFLGQPGNESRLSREEATVKLLRLLAKLPLDELERRVSEAERFSHKSDRSLEGWTEIILNKRGINRAI